MCVSTLPTIRNTIYTASKSTVSWDTSIQLGFALVVGFYLKYNTYFANL